MAPSPEVSKVWIILAIAILSLPVCVLTCFEDGQHGFQDIAEQCVHRTAEDSELACDVRHNGLYESVITTVRLTSSHGFTPWLKEQPTPLLI